MINIFRRLVAALSPGLGSPLSPGLSAMLNKHKKHHHLALATLALILAGTGAYTFRHEIAQAATYTWTQTSWSLGVSATTATHTSNQTGWKYYSATSSSILASAGGVALPTVTHAFTDDGTTSEVTTRPVLATGGTVTYSGLYEIHTFTATGTSAFVLATSSAPVDVQYLVVGGGGGGGAGGGVSGGGGGGGFRTGTSSAMTAGSHTVTVGAGGVASSTGSISVFDTVTAAGGGAGGTSHGAGGGAGGSGGGGAGGTSPAGPFGVASPAGQGNNGGSGSSGGYFSGGGGGGAGAPGTSPVVNTTNGGAGGAGTPSSISGSAVTYAGGGGGAGNSTGGAGGIGGGGAGGTASGGVSGVANTGGGGGGNSGGIGGGSGIVIVRFLTPIPAVAGGTFNAGTSSSTAVSGSGTAASVILGPAVGVTTTGTVAHTTVGGYEIYKYTTAGSFVIAAGSVPTNVEYLVVAGQGGGGGGYSNGGVGQPSVFSTVTSAGGGGGGSTNGTLGGGAGGSGGGGAALSNGTWGSGGAATPSGQGNAGGAGYSVATSSPGGGGGGGAGALGFNGLVATGGNGGNGTTSAIELLGTCPTGNGGTAPNCYYGGGGSSGGGNPYGGLGNGYGYYGLGGTGEGGGGAGGVKAGTLSGMTAGTYTVTVGGGGGGGSGFGGSNTGSTGWPGVVIVRYLTPPPYISSGTFTSAIINLGGKTNTFTTLSWNQTLGTGSISMKARSSNSATMAGATAWASCTSSSANTGVNFSTLGCVTNGDQYVQYQATLNSTDSGVSTPTLNDVTIGYTQYALSGNLTSSFYDSGDTANTINKFTWVALDNNGSALDNADEAVNFQVRSAPESSPGSGVPGAWTNWCGPSTACAGTDYFVNPTNNGVVLASGHPLNTGSGGVGSTHDNDRFLQYKAFLISGGDITPVLSSFTAEYVVNAAPEVQNIIATPNADGTVTVAYQVRDIDTTSATPGASATPNAVKVTLQYCTTGTCTATSTDWTDATAVTGFDSSPDVVNGLTTGTGAGTSWTSKTLTWTPTTNYPNQYNGAQKIRIKANDSEAANNLGYAVPVSGFILDTKVPVVTASRIDSTTSPHDTISLTATDDSSLSFRLCNTAGFSGCDTWNSISNLGVATSTPWDTASSPSTVYFQLRDFYGNITSAVVYAPGIPANLSAADVSNPPAGYYGEFLTWNSSATSSNSIYNVDHYNIYYATTTADQQKAPILPFGAYTPLATSTTNAYLHVIPSSGQSLAYSYKVDAVDTNTPVGDISDWSLATSGDVPDSFGISVSDVTPPTISGISVSTSTLKSVSAVVSFTTSELATSTVLYGTTYSPTCAYGTAATTLTFATAQSIPLTGLTPNVNYFFCVKAGDTAGNVSAVVAPPVAGWWHMDNDWTDASGNGNTGTAVGATFTSSAKVGSYAGSFDGASTHNVVVNNNTSLRTTSNWTQELWVKFPSNPGAYQEIITERTTSNKFILRLNTSGILSAYYYGAAGLHTISTPSAVSSNTYHHIVVAKSGANINLYLDGTSVASASNAESFPNDSSQIYIGSSTAGTSNFNGNIDEYAVYNRALSASEVAAHYNAGAGLEGGAASFTTATGPVIQTVASSTTDTTATISWITANTPSDSWVTYSTDASLAGAVTAGSATATTTHAVTIANLLTAIKYYFSLSSTDVNGNVTTDPTPLTAPYRSFNTGVPLTVSAPSVSHILSTSADVTFVTSKIATSTVTYYKGSSVGANCFSTSPATTTTSTSFAINQIFSLTGLTASTTYSFCAKAGDTFGNVSANVDGGSLVDGGSFTTAKLPVITGVASSTTTDTATITWNTASTSDSYIYYSASPSFTSPISVGSATLIGNPHQVLISGLTTGVTYYFSIKSTDAAGNVSTDTNGGSYYTFTAATDTTAPGFGDIPPSAIVSSSTAIIIWQTTEPATSQVLYSETIGDHSRFTATDSLTSLYHIVTLSAATANRGIAGGTNALTASSTYYYVVKSDDAAGNPATSNEYQFTAASGADVTPPAISNITVPTDTLKSDSATVSFTTDEPATSRVFYGGTSASDCSYTVTASNSSYSTSTQSVVLTGLTQNTTYYFCVSAADVGGNVSPSVIGPSFTTTGGPIIGPGTIAANNMTDNAATISWDTSTSSDSHVYYSNDSALSNPLTAGSGAMVTGTPGVFHHSVSLSGLTAGTQYYYSVKSTDGNNNSTLDPTTIPYHRFATTIDNTPPTIIAGSITTPVLAPTATVIVWQTDELATSKVNYGTTNDGVYAGGVAENSTPSIYHVVTLSADTPNSGGTTGVGGGFNTLTPETTYHFKVFSKDVAGNPSESSDQSFTTPKTGDVTVTVAYHAPADAVIVDTTPPSISGIDVTNITPFGATVTFATSEDTDAFVEYGKDTFYGNTAGDKVYGTTHTVKLSGLTLGTPYHILVSAHDKSSNTGSGADQTFTTKFLSEGLSATVDNIEAYQKEIESAIESVLPSLVPPFVSKPVVSNITESSATISFKTNIKAFPVVVYADDGSYNASSTTPYPGEVSDTVEKTTDHSLDLTGLKGNTKYHIQARAFSLPQVIGKSGDVTFITQASKIAGSIVEKKKDSFTVAWTTDEPTSSVVEFKNAKTGITERKTDDALRTSHSMQITNLPSGTTYSVNLSGVTEAGNIAEAAGALSVTTSVDVTPPVISGFKVDNALVPGRTDRIQTIVSWTTDEPGNSTVFYEEGAGTAGSTAELTNKNEELTSYVTSHSIILPSLKPGTIYRLKVTSADDSGNLASFGPRTVITPQQTASITDIIFKNFQDSFQFLKKI